jgi:hypothetical protein
MDSRLADFVRVATTTTGTSDLTIGSTVTGHFGMNQFTTGDTIYYTVFAVDVNGNPSGDVETGIGTYNTTGTTRLIRDHVIQSTNSNALVNFAAGTKHIICSANQGAIGPNIVNEFRLTVVTNTPIPTLDYTARSTLYYTPFRGDMLTLYTGTGMRRVRSAELSVALSGLTSAKVYDVVLYYNSSGVLKLDLMPAWTNDTTRSSGLTPKQGSSTAGLWVNTSSFTSVINGDSVAANKATHVGTIYTTATTTTEDSRAKRFVWNRYNRVQRPLFITDATSNWTYGTAAWRSWNNSTANRVQWVRGDTEEILQFDFSGSAYSSVGASAFIGIGLDSTSTPSAQAITGGGGMVIGGGSIPVAPPTVYS